MNLRNFSLILLLLFCVSCSSSTYQGLVGQQSPETRFYLTGGETLPASAFKGKTTVIVFWAQWCSKSKQLLHALDEYVLKHDPLGVEYILVSIDKQDNFDKVQEQLSLLKSKKYKVAFSGNEYYDEAYIAFKGEEVPLVIILDRQGKVIAGGHNFDVVQESLKFALPSR